MTWVLWNGDVGGAETLALSLVESLRRSRHDARILFVESSGRLGERLDALGLPYSALGRRRGRNIVLHPHMLGAALGGAEDFAVLVSPGFLAAAARVGGFRGATAAVEHGAILQAHTETRLQRCRGRVDRWSGVWACDAEVAVSPAALEPLTRLRHARTLVCIPNGVDTRRFVPGVQRSVADGVTLGCASRLAPGKGVDDLLRAFALLDGESCRLRIAGGGSERRSLEALATALGVADRVDFLGEVQDVAAFWRDCDVGVVPSNQWIESFGMVAVEAMATGLPVVATRNGGLSAVVEDGVTGLVVEPGDVAALAAGLASYATNAALRREHGRNGRQRCVAQYDVERCAMEYVRLGEELLRRRRLAR
jgi:glycosyltransferase involved in cell wall biosynthesis